jgi:pimeloyl-ACP methyl ester carboxylesterase
VDEVIHVFHGFLGSPDDFKFLQNSNVVLHDLYTMDSIPEINPEDTLIGYSMGGRVALDIALSIDFNLKKLVLINAHPGLSSEEEKMGRARWEQTVLQDLGSLSKDDFMEYWNNLPIFFHDRPLSEITEDRFKKSRELFERYLLSKQEDHLPNIVKHKDKILFIVGLFDEKYMDIVSEYLMPYDIKVKGIPGGHRLFQDEKGLLKVLNDEGIL